MVGVVNVYNTMGPTYKDHPWSLRIGGLYTEVLYCSGVDTVGSPIMVTQYR